MFVQPFFSWSSIDDLLEWVVYRVNYLSRSCVIQLKKRKNDDLVMNHDILLHSLDFFISHGW